MQQIHTEVNWAYTKPGFQGNPDNNDSYFFVVMSMYKKLDSKTKAYRTINMHQKGKLSFVLMKIRICILTISCFILTETFGQGFYNRYSYRTKRHEITFGAGASSCLTDLGGGDEAARGFLWDIDLAKTNFTGNFSYVYNISSRFSIRSSLSFAQISGDDALTSEFYRNNRRLNFVTSLIEGAGIIEWEWIKARTGSRYNLRSPAGRYLGVKGGAFSFGFYVFGGIGGVYFDPSGYDRFIDKNGRSIGSGVKYKLRPLQTEGKSYNKIAICVPAGFGIKKHSILGGIKLEAGYRFTNTDYLDDVSDVYYDWENNGGTDVKLLCLEQGAGIHGITLDMQLMEMEIQHHTL